MLAAPVQILFLWRAAPDTVLQADVAATVPPIALNIATSVAADQPTSLLIPDAIAL
jgi:hypothetical protein